LAHLLTNVAEEISSIPRRSETQYLVFLDLFFYCSHPPARAQAGLSAANTDMRADFADPDGSLGGCISCGK